MVVPVVLFAYLCFSWVFCYFDKHPQALHFLYNSLFCYGGWVGI